MKNLPIICAAVAMVFSATVLFAANTTKVSGNAARDGYLIIDVRWAVDTAKYPGATKEAIYEKVYEDIWQDVVPKLAAKAGSFSSCKGAFSRLSEDKKLVKQRADGSKIFDYSAQIRFDCSSAGQGKPENAEGTSFETFDKGYHDGFTREANSF